MGKLRTGVRRISCRIYTRASTLPVYATYVATLLSHAVIYSLDNLNRRNHRQFQVYI